MKQKQKRISGTIYQPTVIRYVDSQGKRVSKDTLGAKRFRERSKTFRARYTDADGRIRTCSLYEDREASEAQLAVILQTEREIRAGIRRRDPFEKHRSTPLVCPQCSGDGCTDTKGRTRRCGDNHLGDFRAYMNSKDGTGQHVEQTVGRIVRAFEACRFETLDDLDGGRLAAWLSDCRKARKGLSPSTSNGYLIAIKSFGNWLVKDRRLPENPFAFLSRVNQKVDVRVVRRCLSPDELRWLVNIASQAGTRRGLSGPDRAMLYTMAAFTGLRASELRSLTARNLNLDAEPPTVRVGAAYSKNRKESVLPLHAGLAISLRRWLQNRLSGQTGELVPIGQSDAERGTEPLFPGNWHERAAKMLRFDLKGARSAWIEEAETDQDKELRRGSDFLVFETDAGRADFHSLRHTFISNLAKSGVHPKLAKELARHSTITLTMDRYTHVDLDEMTEALSSLEGIPSESLLEPKAQNLVATMVATNPCNHRDSQEFSDVSKPTKKARMTGPKSLTGDVLQEPVSTPEKVRAQGLEPWTYGLKVRCSTN